MYVLIRTGSKDYTAEGLADANRAQDGVVIKANSSKPFVGVDYDEKSLEEVRNKLIPQMSKALPDKLAGFSFDHVDYASYRIAAAAGWGILSAEHAMYIPTIYGQGDNRCQMLTMTKPPLKYDKGGFFSITTYDQTGWIVKEKFALNNKQAKPNEDGSYTFHFNCGAKALNNIDVVDGWTASLRMYLPESTPKVLQYANNFVKTIKASPVK